MTIRAQRAGEIVRMQVSDQAVGFDEELLRDSVNPFLAAGADPTAGRGVGVGLHACRTIAQEHDGRIWAENNPDVGCTFHLEWPAA